MPVAIPLSDVADAWLADLARVTDSAALAAIDGATLLGERAMLGGLRIPGRTSAGGGCRLYDARGGVVALNLARADDRDLLPALFQTRDRIATDDELTARIAGSDANDMVARGRLLGLAIAGDGDVPPPPVTFTTQAPPAPSTRHAPRVLDLSALWAGPLATHLLWLAGAEVTKVESRSRPDAMREGDSGLFALLDQGKTHVSLDLHRAEDRAALLDLISASDIVIEAARPRALEHLGIHADALVRAQPGLNWITITGHGVAGDARHWVGFGDDCGVAGGLTAALNRASGQTGFVGDAIGDPLTGIFAARAAWQAWAAGGGVRLAVAMSGTVAAAMAQTSSRDPVAFGNALVAWTQAVGDPFPRVGKRIVGARTC